ncbi:MAG: hypothetical protein LBB94_01940 [Clostridiales bacterium]|jgi:hypothetical protein|nr:hypothetical protein [Clostridiales bacterium]
MGKRVTVAEAHLLTGLSIRELRSGAHKNIYPCIWIGESRKKILFDIEALEECLSKMAADNMRPKAPESGRPVSARVKTVRAAGR